MQADIFAEWLRRQGHYVFRTQSSYWHDQGPRVYQAWPYHWIIRPSEDELKQLLRQHGIVGLRYSTPVNVVPGAISYHAVMEKHAYDLEDLSKWSRKNVRRGLRNCDVVPITFERLAEEGWELQLDTLARQGRGLKLAREAWRRRWQAAVDLPGFEAWGAVAGRRLAASVTTFQMADCCYMLYQQCDASYLAAHVNNALSFVVTQTMMQRPNIKSILYGLHSLDAPPTVDEFKFRMGYTAKPVRQRVVFHPQLAPLFNRFTQAVVRRLLRCNPSNPTLAKAEGMVRFYLQGQLPLQQQMWPAALSGSVMAEE